MFGDTKAYSSFAVDDLGKAREFYTDTLGLKTTVLDESMGFMNIHLYGDRDTFVYVKPDFTPATYTILNFEVPDVEAAVDELVARGVTMQRYDGFDQDDKGIARGQGPDIAWFEDPAGNVIAVMGQLQQ